MIDLTTWEQSGKR